jgi:hypothetical protein
MLSWVWLGLPTVLLSMLFHLFRSMLDPDHAVPLAVGAPGLTRPRSEAPYGRTSLWRPDIDQTSERHVNRKYGCPQPPH